MKTQEETAFRTCLRILGHWKKLVKGGQYDAPNSGVGFSYMIEITEDFRREMVDNIRLCPSSEEKKDLIIYYIDEIERKLFKGEEFYDSDNLKEDLPQWASPQFQNSIAEKFPDRIYALFEHVCRIIEDYCKAFKIPLVEICPDRFMAVSHFSRDILTTKDGKSELESPEKFSHPEKLSEYYDTNTARLKDVLKTKGFYNIKMVKALSPGSVQKLIEFLSTNDLPYQIAMLDFLGFIMYLQKEYCDTKRLLYKELGDILGYGERTIQGNVNSLYRSTKDSKNRYTAYRYKETVDKDYQKLK